MWLMTTKGRPQAAKQTIDECTATGMKQSAVLYVDGDTTGYDFPLPTNWVKVCGNGNLSGSMQYVFETYPNEKVYGWLADDNHPMTPDWCSKLEQAAHPCYLVHCKDFYISEMNTYNQEQLYQSKNLGAGLCWGGELVRAVGFWSPSCVVQAGIDWFWTEIVSYAKLGIYRPDIIVKHDNWRTGRREKDSVDEWGDWMKGDIEAMKQYRYSKEFQMLKERVLRLCQ